MVTVVPRGEGPLGFEADDMSREPEQRPGSARAAPTLVGAVRAVAIAVFDHPEAALVVAIVVAVLGALMGWW
jgi:hypothetical protein